MSLLLGALLLVPALADVSHPRHFNRLRGYENDDYILYGLTQDCQIFFIRPSQMDLISTLNVNIHSSYCFPNLAQLHLKSHDILLVLIKQAGNRICSFEVQIPSPEILFGDHLFSYSILGSLSYASCSHSSELALEPDLSFLDSVYRNVLYFIDGTAGGLVWDVLQFLVTDEGYLQLLDKLPINNYAKHDWNGPDLANEYVLGLDAQRNYLYQRNRFETNYVYSCSFDLMFRPNKVSVHNGTTTSKKFRTWLNSLSADGSLFVYTETDKTVNPHVTRIFGQNVSSPGKQSHCLGMTTYALELGVVRSSTLRKMRENPLPAFGDSTTTTRKTTVKTTQLGSSTIASRRTTAVPRKTTTRGRKILKATTVHYNTTEAIVTRTRFQETTTSDYYETSTEVVTTTKDIEPIQLGTDSSELPLGFMKDNASLRNTTSSMTANQNATAAVASITVSTLVLYLCMV